MGDVVGDYFVPLFFVAGTAAMWFLAWRFYTTKGAIFRHFGTGLALYGLAFAVFTLAVITKPTNLAALTTLGVLPFAVAHLFFLMAATEKVKPANRTLILLGGVAYLFVLFALRTFVYPSDPGFSENGLFYFNAQPPVVALYITAFAATLIPAIYAVSQQMKDTTLRYVTQIGFTIAAAGGIVLVTSVDDNLQTINGWIVGMTYIVLLSVYASKKIK